MTSTKDTHPARRILLVDDEEFIRHVLTRVLEAAGHQCESASTAAEAGAKVASGSFDLVLCDIHIPGGSGMDFLRQVSSERHETAIVMVTGEDDPAVAREAIHLGAYGYVIKPFSTNEILITVENAFQRIDLERARTIHTNELEAKLMYRNRSLERVIERMSRDKEGSQVPWRETLDRLTQALALRNEETGSHIARVGLYSELLAEKSGLTEHSPGDIRQASMLHDIGKIGISDAILTKPRRLTAEETTIVRRHCELGSQLLAGSESPLLALAAEIALTHHERWDGTGYPRSLAGSEIPIAGSIVAIADVFDAMTSVRPYRDAFPVDEVLDGMRRDRGVAFDPRLVDVFFGCLPEIMEIKDDLPDGRATSDTIRVVVVDDQELFARGLVRLLDDAQGVTVVGVARSVAETMPLVAAEEPDVIVLDWRLPDGNGARAAREVLAEQPSSKIVILTGLDAESVLPEAVRAGCAAVLTKMRAFEEIVGTIRSVHAGEIAIPLTKLSSLTRGMSSPRLAHQFDLTTRELEVLSELAEGLSNEAIAERLFLSLHTVRNHVQRIIMKTGTHSKLEAVTKGVREGIIEIPPRFAPL